MNLFQNLNTQGKLPTKEELLGSPTQFEKLEPKPDQPLCLPGFKTGEFDDDLALTRAYLTNLLRSNPDLRDTVGSPIFHFVVEQGDRTLSAGAKKWVGAIPREISPKETQGFADSATEKILVSEAKRLSLDTNECARLRGIIRNTLTACLHSGLKAVEKAPALNAALGGKENFISYKELEAKAKGIFDEMSLEEMSGTELTEEKLDEYLVKLLKNIGVLKETAAPKETEAMLELITTAKSKAWNLYQQLGQNIQKAQRKAKIPGEIAKVDFHGEHISLHFIEHLRALYKESNVLGQSPEDRFELQTAANLTWLMARLLSHPVYHTLTKHKDEVTRSFIGKVYGSKAGLFRKSDVRKTLYLDDRMKQVSPKDAIYKDDYEVYDSQLEGFDDLPSGMKQIYRGEKLFREKEALSIFIKAMREKIELGNIPDLLAGEAVCMGISENDLDPKKFTKATRVQEFMSAQARAIAATTGLTEDTSALHYSKIPRGSYRIEFKMDNKKKKKESFNFPSVKIYMNVPVNADKSIRMEYRLICGDTWLRGNKQEDSMSHHEMFKLKQVVELLDILTARVYNGQIHPVASEIRKWCTAQEIAELDALEAEGSDATSISEE